jgi:hypothetical protein
MSGWTIVGAAAVTGLFTLGGVILSSWAQTKTIRLGHGEAREQQRLTAYLDFLAQVGAFERFMLSLSTRFLGEDAAAFEAMEEQVGKMLDAFPRLYLLGAAKPCNAASELERMTLELERGIVTFGPETGKGRLSQLIWIVWDDLGGGTRWGGLRDGVVVEMRQDVHPDLGRLATLDPDT